MTSPRPLDLEAYRAPNRAFGVLPFWFLNGELDPDEMLYQLGELRAKGMQGVVFHGRYGLEMPYVGDTYLERVRFGVEEANRLGLASWIYDEMNWPSGTADKRVLKARPDLAQRYLECVWMKVRGPWFMCLTGEDSRYLDFERSTPVAVFAVGEDGQILDLTSNLSFEKVIPWEVPPGVWTLCYIVEKKAEYYIDALDPEATETFLQLGYDPYLKALGWNGSRPEGKDLEGFYSDEPAMHYFLTAQDNAIIPWTKNMFRRFQERNGYNLRPRLIDLFFDFRPDAARTRYDFYNTTTAFYADAYYRQIHEWCQDHHLTFTAHLLFEEWLRQMVRVEGNAFRHYEHMDVVAVDHLYPIIGTRENPAEHVAMKLGSSAAHHFGSERLICESFGGIFMDATMQRMKWIADWEYVLGVTVINPHGFHYTFEGARKRDWPPSMFYQYPWWRYYGAFSDYNSRVSEMLTGGVHVAKVAVVWPINSVFATYKPQERTAENTATEAGLNLITDLLLRLHHDFDYIDEEVLAASEVQDGKLRVAEEAYELVLVPPMDFVREPTMAKLEEFVTDGGRALSVLTTPSEAFGDQGLVDIRDRAAALFGTTEDAGETFRVETGQGQRQTAFLAGSLDVLAQGPGELRDTFAAALDEAICSLIEPDLKVSNPDVFALHRRKDEGDIYFLVNTTFEPQEVSMALPRVDGAVLWDPTTGRRGPRHTSSDGEGTSVEFTLEPAGSTFVVTGPAAEQAGDEDERPLSVDRSSGIEATVEGPWDFTAADDNALVIKEWKAAPEGEDDADAHGGMGLDDSGWQRVVAGAWSYQLPAEPEAEWPIPVWYRASFQVDDVPENLQLLIDGFSGADTEVWLNGIKATAAPTRSKIDAQMKELDLTALVRTGSNVLAIRLVLPGTTSGILDHLKLLGSFGVAGDERTGYRITAAQRTIEPRSWTEQGYPFFSGRGVYSTTFELPSDGPEPQVELEVPMTDDVLEVTVNGEGAGVCLWDPYIVDISKHVRAGSNELQLTVANTPANLLNGVPRPSGIAGTPRLTVGSSRRIASDAVDVAAS